MSEKPKLIPNQALVCVNDTKYLEELVKHYSDKGLRIETFSYRDEFLLLTSKSPIDYAQLRKDVPYEKARYITPVYEGGALLKPIIGVEFKNDLSEAELDDFLQKTGLSLKKKGSYRYDFEVPEGDGEKTLEVLEIIKKYQNVKSASANYLRITKSPDLRNK